MLLDTWAWAELFSDGPRCGEVRQLTSSAQRFVATPTLSELTAWSLRHARDPKRVIQDVLSRAQLLPFTQVTAQLAGEINHDARKTDATFGMVDAMIYATALQNGLQLVTGDPHFKGKPSVVML